jgi:hypothetical protein
MRVVCWLTVLVLTSGMTCGPQPEPVQVPPVPKGPDTYLFQQHLPDCTVVCIEDAAGEACVELRTLRQFVRSLRLVDESELGPGRAHGAGAPLYSAALTVPAPDSPEPRRHRAEGQPGR